MNQTGTLTVNIQRRLDAGTVQFVKAGRSHALLLRNFDPETGEELTPTQMALGVEQIDAQIAEHESNLIELRALREKLAATEIDIMDAVREAAERIAAGKKAAPEAT